MDGGDPCCRPPNMKINALLILLVHSQMQQNQREQAGCPLLAGSHVCVQITQGALCCDRLLGREVCNTAGGMYIGHTVGPLHCRGEWGGGAGRFTLYEPWEGPAVRFTL